MKAEDFLGKAHRYSGLCHAGLALGVVAMLGTCLFSAVKFAAGARQAGDAANRTGHLVVRVDHGNPSSPHASVATARKTDPKPTLMVAAPTGK